MDPGGIEPPFHDCQPCVLPLNDGPTTWYYSKVNILFKQKALLAVVFITGACVLVLEVVAVRILSPFFGNTIYSYSSILSVILGALSLGYYRGGKYADRFPDYEHFFKIILYSGFTVIILEFLAVFFVPGIAYQLSLKSGPLIISMILFAVPGFLLGMLSPYAIKLQDITFPKEGVGKLSGEVFFFSTVGSIIGSLLTGFYLIPEFSIQTIVIGTGIVLILLGVSGLFLTGVKKKSLPVFVLSSSLLISALVYSATSQLPTNIVARTEGVYEQLNVIDTTYRGKDVYLLMQDRSSSSAVIKGEDRSPFEYASYYQLYRLFNTPKRALFVGAGAYTFPNALVQEIPGVQVDVVDIEPKLYDLSKRYFGLVDDNRLTSYVGDGRRFLYDSKDSYDYIYSDVYKTIYSMPVHMTTKEYFELGRSKLTENGIFIINVIGSLKDQKQQVALSEMKTFREVFPNSYFFAVNSPNSIDTQNLIFLGVNGNKIPDLSLPVIIDAVDNAPINLESQRIDITKINFDNHIVFTDNYAPVEQYSNSILEQQYPRSKSINFDGDKVIQRLKQIVDFGPRYVTSEGHAKLKDYLDNELNAISQNVVEQKFTYKGIKNTLEFTNFIVRINPSIKKRVILGTHFDTIKKSIDGEKPIPGANNGGSTTALLIEIAKQLEANPPNDIGVDIILFDGEEGDPETPPGQNSQWAPIGSEYFAKRINEFYSQTPDQAVIVDVVCSKNAQFSYESSSMQSAGNQTKKLWSIGKNIDPNLFKEKIGYTVFDDHTSLQKVGIPSLLVIDFDYPYIYSTQDTLDKCSSETLGKVGSTVLEYIYSL